MNNTDTKLLEKISGKTKFQGAYNVRKNGKCADRKITDNVNIISKEDVSGIDIVVKENTKICFIDIPVIITQSGFDDVVYNDFYIGKNSFAIIMAGCGIHNDDCSDSSHDGIHRFYLEEGAKVKYIENHYGEGIGSGKRILNPKTEIYLKDNSTMEMNTSQIKGVDSTIRITNAQLDKNSKLVINEKIMTHLNQSAKTEFHVELNGENSSVKVTSRSVATEKSKQEFISKVIGNSNCFGHVECDAIIKDMGKVTSTPTIVANNSEANLIHEATIGKIAGDQLKKLMTLGLSQKEAEEKIINGFLK